jgi:hypothetical protein
MQPTNSSRYWNYAPVFPHKALLAQGDQGNDQDELHRFHREDHEDYIHPSRWGIDRDGLAIFEEEVNELWQQGLIPACDEKHDSIQHGGAKKPSFGHDLDNVGPSLYQVTEHYIKPTTKKAGGMSWALMMNPGGLEIDCFATHAWIEGVWEFIKKVRRCWPTRSKGIYVCFLSNPQFGVSKLLQDASVEHSPFYQAMISSEWMLVIPNCKASIYLRKWCVFEGHLALQWALDRPEEHEKPLMKIVLPWNQQRKVILAELLPAILLGFCGYLLGDKWCCYYIGTLFGPVMWLLLAFVFSYVGTWILRMLTHILLGDEKDPLKLKCAMQIFIIFEYLEMFIIFFACGLAYSHFDGGAQQGNLHNIDSHLSRHVGHVKTLLHISDLGMRWEKGEEWSCLQVMAAFVIMIVYKILMALIRHVNGNCGCHS